jgi:hypothetical protein
MNPDPLNLKKCRIPSGKLLEPSCGASREQYLRLVWRRRQLPGQPRDDGARRLAGTGGATRLHQGKRIIELFKS